MDACSSVGQTVHEIGGHIPPGVLPQLVRQLPDLDAVVVGIRAPQSNPFGELGVIVGIVQEQRLQTRRVALSYASSPGDKRRQTATQRFVHRQSVSFVSGGCHHRVSGRQKLRHVITVAQKVNA